MLLKIYTLPSFTYTLPIYKKRHWSFYTKISASFCSILTEVLPKINILDVTSFLYPVGQNCYTAYGLNTHCLYVKHHLKAKPTYCNIDLNHQYHTMHTFTHTLFSLYHTLTTLTHNTLFAHLYIVLVLPDIGSISTPLYTPFLLWPVYIYTTHCLYFTIHCLYPYNTWGLYPIVIPHFY